MRNLKKVLSLTLALVMMLGMMTFAGAAEAKKITAADFKDMDKVENKEAVSLLVDLGILNGVKAADGTYTFNPAGNIERGAYAKMIFAVMMNKDNADVYKGSFTGLSDVKGHWAEGFIAYCVSTKIASGNPDKTFTPNAPIKTVTAAKMLLTGLGYNAKLSHYENDALWSINVMKDAQNAGLLEGVKTAADENLTRDAAAQMIFNALFADQKLAVTEHDMGVEYLKNYVDRYTTKNQLGAFVFDLKAPITGVVIANEANTGATLKGKTTLAGNGSLATTTALEDLGKTVVAYKFGTNGVSTFAFPTSKNHVYTVPTGLSTADKTTKWLNTNGLSLPTGATGATIVNYDYTGTQAISSLNIAKNNVVAYVIDNDGDNEIDVLATITKAMGKVNGDVKTKTAADGTVTTLVPGIVNSYETVVGAEGLKKDDRAMWIEIGDTYFVTKCAVVDGKVTGFKGDDTLYIDKVAYTISDGSAAALNVASEYITKLDYGKDATFYLDENKNVIDAVKVDTTVTTKTAIVLGYDPNTSSTTTESDNIGTAKLLFADGTVSLVKVASFDSRAVTTDTHVTTAPIAVENLMSSAKNALNTSFLYTTYSINDKGNYDLIGVDTAQKDKLTDGSITATVDKVVYKATQDASAGIIPNKAVFCAKQAGIVGDSKTTFLVAEYNSTGKLTGFKSYTGIANAPKFTGDATVSILQADDVAQLVLITAGAQKSVGKNNDYIFIAKETAVSYSQADKTYTYKGYINGTAADVVMNKDSYDMINGATEGDKANIATGNVILVATRNTDGVVIDLAKFAVDDGVAVEYTNGLVKVGSKYYTYTSDVQIVVIDGDTATLISVENITKDGNDAVYLDGEKISDDQAAVIYIVKNDVPAPTNVTLAKVDTTTVGEGELKKGDADKKTGTVTSATAGQKFTVTATKVANATVTITLNGVTADNSADTSKDAKLEYTIAEGDIGASDKAKANIVKVTVSQAGGSDWTDTYTITIAKAAD